MKATSLLNTRVISTGLALGFLTLSVVAMGHGDVTPQEVDTGALPTLGSEPLSENPFRPGNEHGEYHEEAVKVGESGYAGNCAVCHGIQAQSGGLTPDLRELEEWDDEYFIGRVRNGTGKGMPSFKDNLDQNAIWAIKTYVESVKE
ncbi:cytochrome c-550 PedF [Halomonas sp. MCCC 1A17488]|uniref:Cytochrome c-550 PedF n=1 Tax=Billgrantia sulfidoxydans TaxID=2733484 RepID=A0ABX7W7I1_9GAMM|nr:MULTISPECIES: cytochrome c-550 PedF [Halomonas]MCE8017996.1 cytochrome c-550 PedF [Halomonas sp. MCCC 1A17488]MCG3241329.1 cytochrome c-550 PedF [Halomonas sp. MCCC 1A17488]QPP48706.1 cytochrome c-550 PedF [Halomonas sp. SS10-MC5]QTP56045.1 cytochrome c-550 PedF [Halomonas sulfidoxydans]